LQHSVIPKPQHANASSLQVATAAFVQVRSVFVGVLSSVKFDSYFGLEAVEVEDVRSHRVLATELGPFELPPTQ
jgi:hypothetical protein